MDQQTASQDQACSGCGFDQIMAPVQVIGFDWRYLYLNDAAVSNAQHPREELLGRTIMEVFSGFESTELFAVLRECMEERATRLVEFEWTAPDGTTLWFEHCVQPAPLGLFVLSLDVTRRKLTEAALQRSERQFNDFFEFAPNAIVISTSLGVITRVNQMTEKLFGYDRAELVGERCELLRPEASRTEHIAHREGFLASAAPRGMGVSLSNLLMAKKDGTQIITDISLSLLDSDEGEMVVAVFHDVGMREKAHKLALRAQRLENIGKLAGGVAHDLNNALAPIMMATALMRRQSPGSIALIDTIESSAKHGADMVRQLLTFAKGVDGERLLIQPLHLLNEMARIIKSTFPKNIQLRTIFAREIQAIRGDSTQLHQVLLNLCVNARDAMPLGGTLTLKAECREIDTTYASTVPEALPGEYVVWRVTDTGTGMSEETLEHLFEPFYSTKGPDQGTGLGLSTVLGIVQSHGGFVQVYSQPGEGTTFAVYLPIDNAIRSGESMSPKAEQTFCGKGETILVVDDEPAVREVTRSVLTALNFSVVTAVDGTDALVQVVEHRAVLRVVVTDLHMPYMDGLSFLRALKHILPEVGVIVVSGRLDDRESEEFRVLGVSSVLAKPFSEEQLIEALKVVFAPKIASSKPPRTTIPPGRSVPSGAR